MTIFVAQFGPIPPRILGGMRKPVIVVGRDAAKILELLQRQSVQHSRRSLFPRGDGFFPRFRARQVFSGAHIGSDVVPYPFDPRHVPGAGGVEKILGRGKSHRGNHGFQVRRALHRSQPLHSSRIGKAEGSHISVRPPLLGCPLDGVISVMALVFVRPKFAAGSVPATHIFYDDRISTLDCAVKDRIFLLREVLAVGRAINEYRKRPASFGPKDVGTEQNSAAHRNGDILFQAEIPGWRLLCNCASKRRNDEENLTINFHGTGQSTIRDPGEGGSYVRAVYLYPSALLRECPLSGSRGTRGQRQW